MTLTGDLMRFTIPVNMAGLPAISIPVGLSSAGDELSLMLDTYVIIAIHNLKESVFLKESDMSRHLHLVSE